MKARYLLLVLVILAPWLMSDCTLVTDSAAYKDALVAAEAAGDPPDVAYLDNLDAGGYVAAGWLKKVPQDAIDWSDFYPVTVEPFLIEGDHYAVPHDVQSMALVVNQDLLDEAGFRPPQNWDDLAAIVNDGWWAQNHRYGLGMTVGFWSFLPFLYQAGGRLVDEEGWMALDTPEALAALEFYVDPSLKGTALVVGGGGFEQGAYSELLDAFAATDIAMFVGGPGMYNGALQRMGLDPAEQKTVQVYELPAGPNGARATIAFTRAIGLFGPVGEEPGPDAVTFLQYATGPEGLAFVIGDPHTPPDYVPARLSMAGAWQEAHPGTGAFVQALPYARNYLPHDVPSAAYAEFYTLALDLFPQALSGDLPAADALAILQSRGNEILAQYR